MQCYGRVRQLVYEAALNGPKRFDSYTYWAIQRSGREELILEIISVANSIDLTSVDRKNRFYHKVIGIVPKRMTPGSETSDDYFLPTFLSDRVATKVKEQLGVLKHELALKLFDRFKMHSELALFAGWVFESFAHRAIGFFDKTSLMAQARPETVIPLLRRLFKVAKMEEGLLQNVEDLENMYFVPEAMGAPSFDSFIFELKGSEGVVTPVVRMFQMTIGKKQGDLEKGLDSIKLVKERAELYGRKRVQEGQRVGNVELKYVLVIPVTCRDGTWKMPTSWEDAVEGNVFCQRIDTSVRIC